MEIGGLPIELVIHIFYNLDAKSLSNMSMTNNRHNNIYKLNVKNIYSTLSKKHNNCRATNLLEYLINCITHIKRIETEYHDIDKIKQTVYLFNQSTYKDDLYEHVRQSVDFTYVIENANTKYKYIVLLMFLLNHGFHFDEDKRVYDVIIRNAPLFFLKTLYNLIPLEHLALSCDALFYRLSVEILADDIDNMIELLSISKRCLRILDQNILYDNITQISNLQLSLRGNNDNFNFIDFIMG